LALSYSDGERVRNSKTRAFLRECGESGIEGEDEERGEKGENEKG